MDKWRASIQNMKIWIVEDMAWNFVPETRGYKWNEDACQDYQCHYPEGLGYQVLRPVIKI